MNIKVESLNNQLIADIEEIIESNYLETSQFDEAMDLDWEMYLRCGEDFIAIIMRDGDGNVVGILCFLAAPYPHIKTIPMAQQVTFYVVPSYRGLSLDMVKFSEVYLKGVGIELIIQFARYGSGFCKVLDAKGYTKMDVTYTKRLI